VSAGCKCHSVRWRRQRSPNSLAEFQRPLQGGGGGFWRGGKERKKRDRRRKRPIPPYKFVVGSWVESVYNESVCVRVCVCEGVCEGACVCVCVCVGGTGTRREAKRAWGENWTHEAWSRGVLFVVAPAQDEVQGQEVVSVLDRQRQHWAHRHSNTWTTNTERCERDTPTRVTWPRHQPISVYQYRVYHCRWYFPPSLPPRPPHVASSQRCNSRRRRLINQ